MSDHVWEVEKATLYPPLVFVTMEGIGEEVAIFYRQFSYLLFCKSNIIYVATLAWIRHILSFSAVCILGSQSISC